MSLFLLVVGGGSGGGGVVVVVVHVIDFFTRAAMSGKPFPPPNLNWKALGTTQ